MRIFKKNRSTKWLISAKTDISYSIIEYPDLFSSENANLFGEVIRTSDPRRLIIIDREVNKYYGKKINTYFSRHNITIKIVPIEAKEKYKTMETVFTILEEFDNFKLLRRQEPVVAIGGGVLLDVVGLAANLYRRGVPYIRIPTTLVGLIDASIGIKTGVNFNNYKNRIGTYYQPLITYIDPTFLVTLDNRQISNGLAEVLKIALIKDRSLFNLLEKHGKELLLQKFQNYSISGIVLDKAIKGMLEELETNLWESNLERLVDFGHTFSGVLEIKSQNNLLHGEAVAIDMALATIISYQRKYITEKTLNKTFSVMESMRLPIYHKLCKPTLMYKALKDSTLHRDGEQRFPILVDIGKAIFINNISFNEVKYATNKLKKMYSNYLPNSMKLMK